MLFHVRRWEKMFVSKCPEKESCRLSKLQQLENVWGLSGSCVKQLRSTSIWSSENTSLYFHKPGISCPHNILFLARLERSEEALLFCDSGNIAEYRQLPFSLSLCPSDRVFACLNIANLNLFTCIFM